MAGVEFLSTPDEEEPPTEHLPAHRAPTSRRRSRRVVVVAVLAAAAAVGAVVANHPSHEPRSVPPVAVRTTPSYAPLSLSLSLSPSNSVSTLALPERLAFGPQTKSVLAVGNRIFGLTSERVGAVYRDGGDLVVRPAPLALAGSAHPTLLLDARYGLVWTVAIGGTSIGVYDEQHLASRGDQLAPAAIRAATAYLGELWFVTDAGLYRVAGRGGVHRVAAVAGLRAVAADPSRGRVLTLTATTLTAYPVRGGKGSRHRLPFQVGDDMAVVQGRIWVAGHFGAQGVLSLFDPATLAATGPPSVAGSTGAPRFLTTYRWRLIVTGVGQDRAMVCLDAGDGSVLQTWPEQAAGVALNQRGLLLTRGNGIETRSAHDCLLNAG